jgi:hypothetical protein
MTHQPKASAYPVIGMGAIELTAAAAGISNAGGGPVMPIILESASITRANALMTVGSISITGIPIYATCSSIMSYAAMPQCDAEIFRTTTARFAGKKNDRHIAQWTENGLGCEKNENFVEFTTVFRYIASDGYLHRDENADLRPKMPTILQPTGQSAKQFSTLKPIVPLISDTS